MAFAPFNAPPRFFCFYARSRQSMELCPSFEQVGGVGCSWECGLLKWFFEFRSSVIRACILACYKAQANKSLILSIQSLLFNSGQSNACSACFVRAASAIVGIQAGCRASIVFVSGCSRSKRPNGTGRARDVQMRVHALWRVAPVCTRAWANL